MHRVILASLAIVLLRDCELAGPRPSPGKVDQPIVADSRGRFDLPGEQDITAHPVDRGILHPARFSGSVLGRTMTLTVTLTDTAVTLGPVQLTLGQAPQLGPCPICLTKRAAARRGAAFPPARVAKTP